MTQAKDITGQTAGGTRKRRQRGSSSHNFVEALNRVVVAMENMIGTFVERNKQLAAVANKEELVRESIRKLVELGLPEKYEFVVTTMIANCPRYDRAFMFTRKKKMVQYVIGCWRKEGFLKKFEELSFFVDIKMDMLYYLLLYFRKALGAIF